MCIKAELRAEREGRNAAPLEWQLEGAFLAGMPWVKGSGILMVGQAWQLGDSRAADKEDAMGFVCLCTLWLPALGRHSVQEIA